MNGPKNVLSGSRIAAAVIFFHPGPRVFDAVKTYFPGAGKLYAVDNSSGVSEIPSTLRDDPRFVYLPQRKNTGQAAALNLAAAHARRDGYAWLLTMDQDSSFEPSVFEAYLRAFGTVENPGGYALFSPAHRTGLEREPGSMSGRSEPETLMTSGNLLNLAAHEALGGFKSDLFIDTVDHDFCLRARLAGYRLLRFDTLVMNHAVGEALWVVEKGRKVRITTHPPERMYTITRNNLALWARFYRHFPGYIRHRIHFYFFRTLRHIFLYEERKLAKLGFAVRGALDYAFGRFGPPPSEKKEAYAGA